MVFDVNDEASFRSLDRWRADFLSQSGVGEDEAFPFILVGTKIDLEGKGARGIAFSVPVSARQTAVGRVVLNLGLPRRR